MYFQYFQSLSIAPPWNPWNPSSISASFLSWGAQTGHNIPDAISQVLSRRKNSCNTMQNVVVFFLYGLLYQDDHDLFCKYAFCPAGTKPVLLHGTLFHPR